MKSRKNTIKHGGVGITQVGNITTGYNGSAAGLGTIDGRVRHVGDEGSLEIIAGPKVNFFETEDRGLKELMVLLGGSKRKSRKSRKSKKTKKGGGGTGIASYWGLDNSIYKESTPFSEAVNVNLENPEKSKKGAVLKKVVKRNAPNIVAAIPVVQKEVSSIVKTNLI